MSKVRDFYQRMSLDTMWIGGAALIGLLILLIGNRNVSTTEWVIYFILSVVGLVASEKTQPVTPTATARGIVYGALLAIVAILMVLPLHPFDGDWHVWKWLAWALIITGLLMWFVGRSAGAVVLPLVAGLMLGLGTWLMISAFGPSSLTPFNLINSSSRNSDRPEIVQIECKNIVGIADRVSYLDSSAERSVRDELRDWGLDPSNANRIGIVRTALTKRSQECSGTSVTSTPATTAPTSTAPTAAAPYAVNCTSYGKADGWSENNTYQVIVGGLPNDPKAAQAVMLKQAQTNPVFVAGYAMANKMVGGYIDATQYAKDGCWTMAGQALSQQVIDHIIASTVTIEEAPQSGTNSGGYNGRAVKNEVGGIEGDRTAAILRHPDGSTTYVLLRCGNIVYLTVPPAMPVGPTDQRPTIPTSHATSVATSSPTRAIPAPAPKPAPTCPADKPNGTWPNCKDAPTKDPGARGNVPLPVQGTAPSAAPTAAPPAVPRTTVTQPRTSSAAPAPVVPGTTPRPSSPPSATAPAPAGTPFTTASKPGQGW